MQIKEGRYYINRKGEVVGPITRTPISHPLSTSHIFRSESGYTYRDDGSFSKKEGDFELDLIHEIPEGWTIWKGGENPVPGQMVNIMLKTGYKSPGHSISDIMDWHGDEMHVAIIAYKVKETELDYEKLECRIYGNGMVEYRNDRGELHRPNGPAVKSGDQLFWWLNGMFFTSEQAWIAALNPAKEMTVAEISKALGFDVKVVK